MIRDATVQRAKTGEEACELIARYLHETQGVTIAPEDIWNASPTGELSHVYDLYYEAYGYYSGKQMRIANDGAITWVDVPPGGEGEQSW